jgi:integral membrane protein
MHTALGRFRLIGFLEGISFLMLLGIAMPLKYIASVPEPVTIIGAVHGFFFALYLIAIVMMKIMFRWSTLRVIGAVIAALVPFGPFILDARLRREL